eukprot:13699235-Alexandrium_andersonii.AAC.2
MRRPRYVMQPRSTHYHPPPGYDYAASCISLVKGRGPWREHRPTSAKWRGPVRQARALPIACNTEPPGPAEIVKNHKYRFQWARGAKYSAPGGNQWNSDNNQQQVMPQATHQETTAITC